MLLGSLYLLIKELFGVSLGFVNIQGIATIVAGINFTTLGFLVVIAAFMFSLQKYVFLDVGLMMVVQMCFLCFIKSQLYVFYHIFFEFNRIH